MRTVKEIGPSLELLQHLIVADFGQHVADFLVIDAQIGGDDARVVLHMSGIAVRNLAAIFEHDDMVGGEAMRMHAHAFEHRVLQVGGLLFLLGLLVGLAVPRFTVPRLGLSTHLLGIKQRTFLIVGGLLWPKLRFTRSASRIGHGLAIYGCLAAWTANLLGAVWGAGNSMLPMAAGEARGFF